MPGPVSATSTQSPCPLCSGDRCSVTEPLAVNLIALPTRLSRICRTRTASPLTVTVPGKVSWHSKRSPRACASGAIRFTTSAISACSANG